VALARDDEDANRRWGRWSGQHDSGQLADLPQNLEAIHPGHVEVDQEEVPGLALVEIQYGLALAGWPALGSAQHVAAIRPLFEAGKGNLIKSAEQLPEANYGFKPVATVRSFGQLLGHLANENYLLCAAAKGEPNPMATEDFEKNIEKAALVKALQESLAYCDAAYAISDAQALEQTEIFGMKGSKLWALTLNITHNGEHYGNLVTYFRIKGMVPPSSQRSGS